MKHVEELAEKLTSLDVKELKYLSDHLKDKYGLEMAQAAAPATTAKEEVAEEEPAFSALKIVAVGEKKLSVVKELNSLSSCGLSTAKTMIDSGELLFKNKDISIINGAIKTFETVSPGFVGEVVNSATAFEE